MSIIGFSIYLIIGLKAFSGLYSIGNIVCYIGGCFQIINAITEVVGIFGKLTNLKPRINLYYEIIDVQSKEKHNKELLCTSTHRIEFKNVCYRYENNNHYAVYGLNYTINSGEKIAIVGENGSGKTTFIKLLCGLIQPNSGEILIDNKNIETYDIEEYSKIFSVVFQDFQIFSFPLGENIAVSQNVNNETAINCLNRIGFEPLFSLKQYLFKDCEKTGVEISGGEAQKIAMARALYKDAPFIVLDEPTASLDPFAEFQIYSNFNELTKNKTVIYISHRLSSCAFCDKIIVFEKGQITQTGTHKDLIRNTQGKYYELWNSQAQYYK
jgi:ATP-binding cassette subfamily B protein